MVGSMDGKPSTSIWLFYSLCHWNGCSFTIHHPISHNKSSEAALAARFYLFTRVFQKPEVRMFLCSSTNISMLFIQSLPFYFLFIFFQSMIFKHFSIKVHFFMCRPINFSRRITTIYYEHFSHG